MHAKYNNKGWHRRDRGTLRERAGRDKVERRQFGDGGQLTGPVTLTVIVVQTPTPISTDTPGIPPPVTTTTFVTAQPSPQTISIPAGTVSTSDLSSSSFPSSTTTLLTPTPALSPSPPGVSDSPASPSLSIINPSTTSLVPDMPDKDANQSAKNNPKLSTGAIAGIVIGCLVVLIIAVIFGLRKRSAKKQSMSSGSWYKRLGFGPRNLEPTPYMYNADSSINGQGLSGGMDFTGMPVTTTGDTGNIPRPTSPRSMSTVGLGLPRTLPSAYGPDSGINSSGPTSPSQTPVLFTTVVSRSFLPTLPDELSISTGETLGVLQEFDDGWAECMTLSGEIGMVPLACISRRDEGRKLNRYSSLPGARRIV